MKTLLFFFLFCFALFCLLLLLLRLLHFIFLCGVPKLEWCSFCCCCCLNMFSGAAVFRREMFKNRLKWHIYSDILHLNYNREIIPLDHFLSHSFLHWRSVARQSEDIIYSTANLHCVYYLNKWYTWPNKTFLVLKQEIFFGKKYIYLWTDITFII